MKLSEIAENICRPLETITGHPVVIAGGAVRDRLWGRKPQDYDIFILTGKLGPPMMNLVAKRTREWVWGMSKKGDTGVTAPWFPPGGGAMQPMATFRYHGWKVQVMQRPVKTVPELLATFDFDICQFAYRYGEVTKPASPGWNKLLDHKYHGHITLNRDAVKTRFSLALRRGIRFSERYDLTFTDADSNWLCEQMASPGETQVAPKSASSGYMKYLTASAVMDELKSAKQSLKDYTVTYATATGSWYDELLWGHAAGKQDTAGDAQ